MINSQEVESKLFRVGWIDYSYFSLKTLSLVFVSFSFLSQSVAREDHPLKILWYLPKILKSSKEGYTRAVLSGKTSPFTQVKFDNKNIIIIENRSVVKSEKEITRFMQRTGI